MVGAQEQIESGYVAGRFAADAFDAGIDLYSRRQRMRLRYKTPYVRDLPMTLEIQESTDRADANQGAERYKQYTGQV